MRVIELGASDVVGPGGGWLYESPLWDHRRGVLLWTDIEDGDVHVLDPATGVASVHRLGGTVACLGLRSGGGYVVGLRTAVAVADPDFERVEVVAELPAQADDIRLNDGAVSPDGAFWVGTMSHDRTGAGGLWRIGADRSPTLVVSGVSISNGSDWSADGRQYYADTMAGRVDVLETELDGTLSARRPFFVADDGPGLPDGLTVDAAGNAWVALWGAGTVVAISPMGEVVAEVRLPVPQPSSVAFGGPDLTDLYVTTARENLDDDALAAYPLSGSVFCWRGDVRGLPAHEWRG